MIYNLENQTVHIIWIRHGTYVASIKNFLLNALVTCTCIICIVMIPVCFQQCLLLSKDYRKIREQSSSIWKEIIPLKWKFTLSHPTEQETDQWIKIPERKFQSEIQRNLGNSSLLVILKPWFDSSLKQALPQHLFQVYKDTRYLQKWAYLVICSIYRKKRTCLFWLIDEHRAFLIYKYSPSSYQEYSNMLLGLHNNNKKSRVSVYPSIQSILFFCIPIIVTSHETPIQLCISATTVISSPLAQLLVQKYSFL